MLARIGDRLTGLARTWVPDPFVLALLLTVVTLLGAVVYRGGEVTAVLADWTDGPGGGFWRFLSFGMQMCLILVTGHALASSPWVERGLDALAARAATPRSAIAIVAGTAMALGLLNWGLGLIAGALLARRVGLRARDRGVAVHYPMLAAAGYMGMLVWHGGLSGSAPLKVTLDVDLVEVLGADLARRVGAIDLGATIGAWPNLLASGVIVVLVPWLLIRMQPEEPEGVAELDVSPLASSESSATEGLTPAMRLGHSRWLAWGVAAVGAIAWTGWLGRRGIGRLDPNMINFLFLFLGLALHGSAVAYGRAISNATRGCAGIVLQFPFYAGIAAVLAASGLVAVLGSVVSSVGPALLPAAGFYAAGLVNLFVPSGGGQWGVQGAVYLQSAVDLGVDPARMVMALAYGDQWTNMLQPFWALPLLAITGVRAQQIVGYTAVVMLVVQIPFLIALYL